MAFDVWRKNIKSIRITVLPPLGNIKVTASRRIPLDKITDFISSRLIWIKKHQKRIRSHKGELPKKYKAGEKHSFFGEKFMLKVIETDEKPELQIRGRNMYLYIKPKATKLERQKIIEDFYRLHLKKETAKLIAKYEPKMRVRVKEFGVKKMKTRWGTCNPAAKRIWLSLELAKKSKECLEHIVVHEMVHLLEASHNKRFYEYMDKFFPKWQKTKEEMRYI